MPLLLHFLAGVYRYGWDQRTAAVVASVMGAATCENRETGEEEIGTLEQARRLLDQCEDGVRVKKVLVDEAEKSKDKIGTSI